MCLLPSAEAAPQTLHPIQALQTQRDLDKLQWIQ